MDVNQLFASAEREFREGRFDQSRNLLVEIAKQVRPHPAVLHLRALVEKGSGDFAAAKASFEQALDLAPNDRQIRNNYGNLLLAVGEDEHALDEFDRLLSLFPDFAEGRVNRALVLEKVGRLDDALSELDSVAAASHRSARLCTARASVLRRLGRLAEAAAAYDEALELDPERPTALHGRALVAMERGEPETPRLYERALAVTPEDLALHLGYAEALEAEGDPRASEGLERLVETNPDWAEGQAALARMRWQAGDRQTFTRDLSRALDARPTDVELWIAYISTLATADLWAEAAQAADEALGKIDDPRLRLLAAIHWSNAGEQERAGQLLVSLPAGFPGRARAEVRHRIRLGEYDRALALAETDLRDNPWDVPVWATVGLLWRLLEHPRAAWLHEQPGLVAVQALELDTAQIGQVADVLRGLHRTRAHPLGQSLRGGTQTRGRLFDREEPEVLLLRDAIFAAVERHWQALPPVDSTHPLLRHRDKTPQFAGSWSVRLTGGGFHVAHIHAEGLVSSACYLVVPEAGEPHEGWLEIGRAPPELGLDLEPLTMVKPEPGRLALFPSTLLHGTRPFADGERLTAAFDIVASGDANQKGSRG